MRSWWVMSTKTCILCSKQLSPVSLSLAWFLNNQNVLIRVEGRAFLDESPDELQVHNVRDFEHGASIAELQKQTEDEIEAIRIAVVSREGLILDVFSVLRRVPRRVLMVLKLNDLTRRAGTIPNHLVVVFIIAQLLGALIMRLLQPTQM